MNARTPRACSPPSSLARNSTDRSLLTERAASDARLGCRVDLARVGHDLNNLLGESP